MENTALLLRESRRAATTSAAMRCNPRRPPRRAGPAGQNLHYDGPFAETKEQLGGFYLINATDLNEAIQVASRIPSARSGLD